MKLQEKNKYPPKKQATPKKRKTTKQKKKTPKERKLNKKQEQKKQEQKSKPKQRSKSDSKSQEEEGKLPELIPAEVLGIQLISKKSRGWPANLSMEEIVTGLEEGTYKWFHTKEDIPDEIIYKMIVNNEIRLKSCWSVSDDSTFATLKNGLTEENSATGKQGKPKSKPK